MGRITVFLLVVAATLAGTGLGIGVVALKPQIGAQVRELKREVRVYAGLPKFWVPLDPEDDGGRRPTECPDPARTLVLVTGGQSNASNAFTGPLETAEGVFTWFAGSCYPTRDPVLGATAGRASLWPPLGQALAQATGRPVLLINGAVGGTEYADWLDERSGYLSALTGRIRAARAAGYEPAWILWHQGETDATVGTSGPVAQQRLTELISRLRQAAPEARVYLYQASLCGSAERAAVSTSGILEAQAKVAAADPDILLGMNTDQLGGDYRSDGCHFNSFGKKRVVEKTLSALLDASEGAGR